VFSHFLFVFFFALFVLFFVFCVFFSPVLFFFVSFFWLVVRVAPVCVFFFALPPSFSLFFLLPPFFFLLVPVILCCFFFFFVTFPPSAVRLVRRSLRTAVEAIRGPRIRGGCSGMSFSWWGSGGRWVLLTGGRAGPTQPRPGAQHAAPTYKDTYDFADSGRAGGEAEHLGSRRLVLKEEAAAACSSNHRQNGHCKRLPLPSTCPNRTGRVGLRRRCAGRKLARRASARLSSGAGPRSA